MPSHRFPRLAAAATCALLLTGCLDYEEEMWVNSDLSGHAVVTVTLPNVLKEKFADVQTAFEPDKMRRRFADAKGVTLVSYNLNTEAGRPVATLEVQFASLEALSQLAAANPPAAALVGKIEIARDGKETKITRGLGSVPAPMDLGEGNFAQYVIHFPAALAYTNSTRDDGAHDTVRYNFRLEDVFARQPAIINTLPRIIPWKWILISLGVAVLLGYAAWLTWRKKLRKKS